MAAALNEVKKRNKKPCNFQPTEFIPPPETDRAGEYAITIGECPTQINTATNHTTTTIILRKRSTTVSFLSFPLLSFLLLHHCHINKLF